MDLASFGLTDIVRAETAGGVPLVSGSFPTERHDEVWRSLRADHSRTGMWPVLNLDAESTAAMTERFGAWQGTEWLAEALTVDPVERMAVIRQAHYEWCVEDYVEPTPEDLESREYYDQRLVPERLVELLPEFIAAPPGIHRESSRIRGPKQTVLLVPAAAGYELPALVPGCLKTNNWVGGASHPVFTRVDQVAILRYFHQTYGAELYHVGPGIELAVDRPPTTPLAIATCAIEQYAFCDDLSQVLGDIEVVAVEQAPADHWTFWWD